MRQKDSRTPVWQGPGDESHPSVSLARGFLKDVWQKQKGGSGTGKMSRLVQEAQPQVTKSLPSAPVTSSSVASRQGL